MLNILIDSCADLDQQLIYADSLRIAPLHLLVGSTFGLEIYQLLLMSKAPSSILEFHSTFSDNTECTAGCLEDAPYLLVEKIKEQTPIEKVIVTTAVATIDSHCCHDSIVIV